MADIRGLARLGFDAAVGVTNLVEQMHRTISDRAAPLGSSVTERTQGVTGFVYDAVRGTTRLASRGVDVGLRLVETVAQPARTSRERETALAAINGLWGDHLEATSNPLAIPMSFRVQGRVLDLDGRTLRVAIPDANGRVAVLVHGLCMNDLQWQRDGHDHRAMLARDLGYCVVSLHYNSGLHISENGSRFAALLDTLVAHWPVPVDELAIVGHSMGGLVARSACHEAEEHALRWRSKLTKLVCLGKPHHGAPLERGGHRLDRLLDLSPYVAPFTRLGKARSAGVTDLRFGNLRRCDWEGRAAHDQGRDDRRPMPLPEDVAVYLLAATTADRRAGLRHALVGDGLVTLASAWGQHHNPAFALRVPTSHKALMTRANHWDLLSRPEAADCCAAG